MQQSMSDICFSLLLCNLVCCVVCCHPACQVMMISWLLWLLAWGLRLLALRCLPWWMWPLALGLWAVTTGDTATLWDPDGQLQV